MKRRELLQYTAVPSGAALSAPLIAALAAGCATPTSNSQISRVGGDLAASLNKLVDVILPQDDSPSATEVGVVDRIRDMVDRVMTANESKDWLAKSEALVTHLQSQN